MELFLELAVAVEVGVCMSAGRQVGEVVEVGVVFVGRVVVEQVVVEQVVAEQVALVVQVALAVVVHFAVAARVAVAEQVAGYQFAARVLAPCYLFAARFLALAARFRHLHPDPSARFSPCVASSSVQ